ncbi:outer membrane lipoprotein-sorting protein [Haliovirga abyssi]|uniref:Sigma E regulatory protein, MucB/RseB n=1 Tax=Haliovirga abyssi TaxID=2996794 RepID=A0AAU9D209_9FUSO|nr:outer membrane lipoprotein-sorting protein [Haliovirga abyssi]BDU50036.1 sigma E regulatory protein, MucB/RseB [Haliovirga abyssi]
MKRKLIAVIMMVMVASFSFAMTGKEIMQKAHDRDTGNSIHGLMGMDLIDKDGNVSPRTIEMWGETYDVKNDLSRTVMVFKAPAAVKGTRFLQIQNKGRDDDKWIYLPALGRVRRISSSEGSSSFMGSDFTYDDMSSRDVDKDTHKLLKEEKLGNYDCYVVESQAKNPEDSQYKKIISWITKDSYIAVKIDMYSKKTGKIQKEASVKQNIKKIGKIWTIFETTMKDMENGHSTKLYIKQSKKTKAYYIKYNSRMNPKRFTQRYLKNGR